MILAYKEFKNARKIYTKQYPNRIQLSHRTFKNNKQIDILNIHKKVNVKSK